MKKNIPLTISIVIILLSIIECILMGLEIVFNKVIIEHSLSYVNSFNMRFSDAKMFRYNFFGVGNPILAIITTIIIVLSIIFFIILIIDKFNNDSIKYLSFITIVSFVFLLFSLFMVIVAPNEIHLYFGAYLIIGLHIVSIVLSILLFNKIRKKKKE